MKYSKYVVTAFVAAAATGVAAGTGYAVAEPVPAVQDQQGAPQVRGSQQGVDYVVSLAQAGNGIITRVTGGQFRVSADGKSVALENQEGAVLTRVNLSSVVAGKQIDLAAAVDQDGRQLTLTSDATPVMSAKDISGVDWFISELQHAAIGGLIGGLIGLIFVGIGAIPGAIIGLLVAGGQPLIDSGSAALTGQP
ncbi:hypothetical protein D7D52_19655 [Nocardia yunnanensis]|uniref:DUF8020 domain-containing protein n=1 Tax=Nocardia yunnanensis TaxID=2382165 RepID=A0A386ZDU0_9NOCA|nr:hypothetical protein [Nocardia yunnanensis]AYF75696.1 hypothetical protein D7D52_19655 [Nocardia yunnanensis]